MHDARREVTEEDLNRLPMLRLKMLYGIPPQARIGRNILISRIKERGYMPYDDGYKEYETLSKVDDLDGKSWAELLKIAKVSAKGHNRQSLMELIRNGRTDSTNDNDNIN